LHYADPEFSRYLTRSNRYTSLQASQWVSSNSSKKDDKVVPKSSIQEIPTIGLWGELKWMIFNPVKIFVKIYFRHKAFLDGFPGFVWAMYSALHVATSYVKFWEKGRRR
jgi:hypothetical protein